MGSSQSAVYRAGCCGAGGGIALPVLCDTGGAGLLSIGASRPEGCEGG